MTVLDIHEKMEAVRDQEARNAAAIVAFVRPIVSMLKDLGREHTAKELERLLFVHDAFNQDQVEWIRANQKEIATALLELAKGRWRTR
jgi:hypothetical protein